MPYSVKSPPDWLKNMPAGAVKIGVEVFNSVHKETGDEDKARKASWAAIKARYEKGEDGKWHPKKAAQGAERSRTLRFQAARMADESGLVWEAVIIAPGLSDSWPRFYWSEEVLEAAVDVFSGVDINAYELTADFFTHLPIPDLGALENVKRFLAAKKVGWIEKAWYEPGAGVKATIRFLAEQAWLPRMLADGADHGNPDVLGLSIDARVKGVDIAVDDMTVVWVTSIVSCSSVDVVTHPAAGGKFLRAVAALNTNAKEIVMDREKLLKAIEQAAPDLLKKVDRAALSDDEIVKLCQQAGIDPQTGEKKPAAEPQPAPADPKPAPQPDPAQPARQDRSGILTLDQVQKLIEKSDQRAACGRILDSVLGKSGLPEPAAARVRERFEGQIFEKQALEAAVKTEKDYLAAMNAPGFDVGDQTRINVGLNTLQRAQMAVDRMFGLSPEQIKELAGLTRLDGKPFFEDVRSAQAAEQATEIPAFSGLREMYEFFTGDAEVSGRFRRERLSAELRASQDVNSATFSYILGNTLARRLVADYRAANWNEDLLISIRKPTRDFRTQEAVMVGYFPDLASVDPETADYDEIAGVTDEESTYAILQKGNILTITRKTVINDDVSLIMRLVSRLGRAARRTHAKYVWTFWINNSACSDGTAWFTSGHGNLGATALSFAQALIAYKALAKMTEKDSGERIGLLADPQSRPTLVGPVDLLETIESIVNDEYYFSSNDLTTKTRNPLRGKIGGYVNPLLTDANDWGLLMPASEVDIVEMGYLNGRQEPEFFAADQPTSEQVFVADKTRYKIRHEYAGTPIDFRSGWKAQVT